MQDFAIRCFRGIILYFFAKQDIFFIVRYLRLSAMDSLGWSHAHRMEHELGDEQANFSYDCFMRKPHQYVQFQVTCAKSLSGENCGHLTDAKSHGSELRRVIFATGTFVTRVFQAKDHAVQLWQ